MTRALRRRSLAAGVLLGLLAATSVRAAGSDLLAIAETVPPEGPPEAVVFLLSDAAGWTAADGETARALATEGALVVGIDLSKTLARAETEPDRDCTYLVGAIEAASHAIQKTAGGAVYRDPVVAGAREGGGLALALLAQTPAATIGRTIAVDPSAGIALERPLCTGAPKERPADGRGWVYGLEDHPLSDPATVVTTAAADPEGADHAEVLAAAGSGITLAASDGAAADALVAAVGAVVAEARAGEGGALGDLPLAVLPATPRYDTMAIVLSGDGGWRDIDAEIAGALATDGVPTIGLDSLRYFWSEKPPETIAADLARIVDRYGPAFGTRKVALVGYSFGADVLPAAYAALPQALKARVVLVSLLAFSATADFEFKVSGLLGVGGGEGARPTLPDVERMPKSVLQCVYGAEDEDAACDRIGGVEVVRTTGGHHFDGDYEAIARRILARLGAPVAGPAATPSPTP